MQTLATSLMWSRLKWKMVVLPGSTGASIKVLANGAFFCPFSSAWNLHELAARFSSSLLICPRQDNWHLPPLLLIVGREVRLKFGGSLKVINYCLRINCGARVRWKIGEQSSRQPRTPRRNVWERINIYVRNQIQHPNPSGVLIYGEEETMNNHQGMCCWNLF